MAFLLGRRIEEVRIRDGDWGAWDLTRLWPSVSLNVDLLGAALNISVARAIFWELIPSEEINGVRKTAKWKVRVVHGSGLP